MECYVELEEWNDYKFQWDPSEYGGVTELYVPSETIWLPDIVLYNNADGEYIVTTMTKAVLHYNGKVVWSPPAIFKSSCEIDVKYFPFDQQSCFMKFGSWTYDGFLIDLKHLDQKENETIVEIGIDLKEYYPSVEWDIMNVPAVRNEKFYPCCNEPYPDIYFNITLRRKTLFYTVNLIVPCVGLEYLSILVFYLPAYSGEKVALCISILLSQTMFFLLISEIMPSTSLAVPLLGKYLLFTMLLVGLNVLVTIIVLNIHYRNPSTHKMAPWVKLVFMDTMPCLLGMKVPKKNEKAENNEDEEDEIREEKEQRRMVRGNGNNKNTGLKFREHRAQKPSTSFNGFRPPGGLARNLVGAGMGIAATAAASAGATAGLEDAFADLPECFQLGSDASIHYPSRVRQAVQNVQYIRFHIIRQDKFKEEDDDWAFVAMVLDRLLLWIFLAIAIASTILILFESPFLYDMTPPIDMQLSQVAQALRLSIGLF